MGSKKFFDGHMKNYISKIKMLKWNRLDLPNILFLDGDWEVGLAEIQYPYTWNDTRSGKNRAYIKTWNERGYTSSEIPAGYHDDINNRLLCWIFGFPEVALNLVFLSSFSALVVLMSADIARNL